jgi:hypothetical protein
MSDRIVIEGRDGAFRTYIARPAALPAPAVVRRAFAVGLCLKSGRTLHPR